MSHFYKKGATKKNIQIDPKYKNELYLKWYRSINQNHLQKDHQDVGF